MEETTSRPAENGFEIDGEFYAWHVSDIGKDLMLIDRIAGLPIPEFFEIIDDDHARERAPILLALMATSIRHGHPDWTVDRISRAVMNLNLSDVEFITGDDEEVADELPPPSVNGPPPSTGDSSASESRSTSSETAPETSETFNATPV